MACNSDSEPYRYAVDAELTTSHALADGAKVSGTAMRLRQFEADHHSEPVTGTSGCSPPPLYAPASKCPVSPHCVWMVVIRSGSSGRSAAGRPMSLPAAVPAESQLMPSIGMISSVPVIVSEQPSDALLSSVYMTNLAAPLPCASAPPSMSCYTDARRQPLGCLRNDACTLEIIPIEGISCDAAGDCTGRRGGMPPADRPDDRRSIPTIFSRSARKTGHFRAGAYNATDSPTHR